VVVAWRANGALRLRIESGGREESEGGEGVEAPPRGLCPAGKLRVNSGRFGSFFRLGDSYLSRMGEFFNALRADGGSLAVDLADFQIGLIKAAFFGRFLFPDSGMFVPDKPTKGCRFAANTACSHMVQ